MKNDKMGPVQNFAFGGIANPTQRATLRASDRGFLADRQRELDAFEAQRLAYNDALTRYNQEVYDPYQAQVGSYNEALNKYRQDVYDPYQAQFDAYQKAVQEYNAGPRTEDYRGPAAPTLGSQFERVAPTMPGAFDMSAPVLPFDEAKVVERQKQAAETARRDAGNRATAINVVSDPERFGFGSLSIADRFMAEGGFVEKSDDSARGQLAAMRGQVAGAGRLGDEELAYLSPSARALLTQMGGSGTINPRTGLPEFFGKIPAAAVAVKAAEAVKAAGQRPTESYRKPPSVQPGDAYYESPEYKAYVKEYRVNDRFVPRDAGTHESPYFGYFPSMGLGKGADRAYESYMERVAREAKEAAPPARPIPITPPAMPVTGQPITRDPVPLPPAGAVPGPAPVPTPGRGPTPLVASDISQFITGNLGGGPVAGVGAAPGGSPARPMLGGPPARPSDSGPRPAIAQPSLVDYSSRGVGTAQQNLSMPMFGGQPARGAGTNPQNYFSMMGPAPVGQLPGTVASAPMDMPFAAGQRTLDTLGANPNLSPGMLGGAENAGVRYDRLGNPIFAPGMGPLMFAEGGEVSAEDEAGVGEIGSAAQLLAQLEAQEPRRAKKSSITARRVRGQADGAPMPKGMGMEQEPLGSVRELVKMATEKGSAKEQMQELARLYQLRAATFNQPSLTGQTLGKKALTAKRFKEGGEVTDPEAALFEGRDDVPVRRDETAEMIEAARKDRLYQDLEQYLQLRDAMPSIKVGRTAPYEGTFTFDNLNIGDGSIKVGKDMRELERPSVLIHEMTHAADRQMKQQAIEQGMFGKNNQLTEAYEKLVGPEGRNRTKVVRAMDPEYEEVYRDYRTKPNEIAAFGVGAFAKNPSHEGSAPDHVDATAATEFMMLLDLAQRNVDKGPKGLSKIPAALRKLGRYAEGGEVTDPYAQLVQDAPRERVSPLQFGRGMLDTGAGMLKGAVQAAAGGAGDIESLGRMLAGSKSETVLPTTDDMKKFIDRFAPLNLPADPGTDGRTAAEYFGEFMSPAAATRPLVRGAQAVGSGVMEGARQAEKALDAPVTRIMERGGRAADLLESFAAQPSRVVPSTPAPTGSVKTPAPASELGFYSAAEQAALNLPRKEGTGAAFLNDLMKAPDVKKEELSAMGLDEFLKSKPKATRQEVQDFIASNRFDVKEVQLGNLRDQFEKKQQEAAGKLVDLINAQDGGSIRLEGTQGKVFSDEALYALQDGTTAPSQFPLEFQGAANGYLKAYEAAKSASNTKTKFDPYQLPGGDNYREILLTIPTRGQAELNTAQQTAGNLRRQTADLMAQWKSTSELSPGTPETVALYQKVAESRALMNQAEAAAQDLKDQFKSQTYKSSHFDEPNILAHLRVNDRVDADGKKMLLIEELQSDWHQAGRDKGYKSDIPAVDRNDPAYVAARTRATELLNEFNANNANRARQDQIYPLLEEAREAEQQFVRINNKRYAAVPDAPFKDTWHQLALKRALKYAADNGYDRVGLTTGKQQAQRYDLSKQVDNISYEPTEKGFYINVMSSRDGNVLNGDYSVKELEGIVGKEITQKMLGKEGANAFDPKVEPDLAKIRKLTGVDLQVGGEGMKKYYDEIYPGFLAKQAKKYGSQVGETNIKMQTSAPAYVDYIVGRGNFTDTTVLGVRADGSTEIINQNPNSLQEAQQLANRYKEKHLGGGKEAVRYIDITPGMKGAVPYAKGGPVDKNTAFIKAHS